MAEKQVNLNASPEERIPEGRLFARFVQGTRRKGTFAL